jgi:hypothetical protein
VKTNTLHRHEVGMTLVCPQCDLAVVVVDVGSGAEATMTCHTVLQPARPMRCWRVYERPLNAGTVAGALYIDDMSGLTVRCTRPGLGALCVSGRPMSQSIGQPRWIATVIC